MTCAEPKWKTCGECAHFAVCWAAKAVMVKQHKERGEITRYCEHFLDRARQISLPVGSGEWVFLLGKKGIRCGSVKSVRMEMEIGVRTSAIFEAEEADGLRFSFSEEDLGDVVFLCREEAEAAWAARAH